ncbi:MAG TPA: hypothetical protein VFA60_11055 [Terriglobales bacterium]|nr:hypothetical protein [Terriglobales bacterium]
MPVSPDPAFRIVIERALRLGRGLLPLFEYKVFSEAGILLGRGHGGDPQEAHTAAQALVEFIRQFQRAA